MVERGGLENRCPFGDRGFESLTLCIAQSLAWNAGLLYFGKVRRRQGPSQNTKDSLSAAKKALCDDSFLKRDRDDVGGAIPLAVKNLYSLNTKDSLSAAKKALCDDSFLKRDRDDVGGAIPLAVKNLYSLNTKDSLSEAKKALCDERLYKRDRDDARRSNPVYRLPPENKNSKGLFALPQALPTGITTTSGGAIPFLCLLPGILDRLCPTRW